MKRFLLISFIFTIFFTLAFADTAEIKEEGDIDSKTISEGLQAAFKNLDVQKTLEQKAAAGLYLKNFNYSLLKPGAGAERASAEPKLTVTFVFKLEKGKSGVLEYESQFDVLYLTKSKQIITVFAQD